MHKSLSLSSMVLFSFFFVCVKKKKKNTPLMFTGFINLQRKLTPLLKLLIFRSKGICTFLINVQAESPAEPNRTLVLSLTFCMHVSLGTKVDL